MNPRTSILNKNFHSRSGKDFVNLLHLMYLSQVSITEIFKGILKENLGSKKYRICPSQIQILEEIISKKICTVLAHDRSPGYFSLKKNLGIQFKDSMKGRDQFY